MPIIPLSPFPLILHVLKTRCFCFVLMQVYERLGEEVISAQLVKDEFSNEYDDDAVSEVFNSDNDKLDKWRRVSICGNDTDNDNDNILFGT